uniref:Uncharacterized protein n=1 Tax=Acrobeloides nanus TaxID=290746 RepID=A0A914E5N1_9BILA
MLLTHPDIKLDMKFPQDLEALQEMQKQNEKIEQWIAFTFRLLDGNCKIGAIVIAKPEDPEPQPVNEVTLEMVIKEQKKVEELRNIYNTLVQENAQTDLTKQDTIMEKVQRYSLMNGAIYRVPQMNPAFG